MRKKTIEMKHFDTSSFRDVGEDVIVDALASITRPELVSIGNHVSIDPWFHCSTGLRIKNHVHISSGVSIIGGEGGFLEMGNFTNISAHGTIVCGSDEFKGAGLISAPGIPKELCDNLIIKPVIFGDFVNLGVNVTILPGVTLPEGVVIGACSLVKRTDKLEPWTIYAGNPLKKICSRPKQKMIDNSSLLI